MIALVLVLLAGGQQAAAVPTTLAATDAKVRCRVEPVTGTLAQRTRTCHTVAEWRAIDDANNQAGRHMIEQTQEGCYSCAKGGG